MKPKSHNDQFTWKKQEQLLEQKSYAEPQKNQLFNKKNTNKTMDVLFFRMQ
jgi:hypothetical protein